MFYDIVLIASFFLIRIALPLIATLMIGLKLERALHREAPNSPA